jgi:hypothetical protein
VLGPPERLAGAAEEQASTLADSASRSWSTARTPCSRRATVPAPNDTEWQIKRAVARGRLAALADTALAEARAATALADRTEALTFRADAYRDPVDVAARIVQRGTAEAAARTALALYAAKESVAGAAQVALTDRRPTG